MKASRSPGFRPPVRRASLPAILEEVVGQQPEEMWNSCGIIGENENSNGTIIQAVEGNEMDSDARKTEAKLKKPFKKMASEPILGHRTDPGNAGQLLFWLGLRKSVSREQRNGSTPPERQVPKGKKKVVNDGRVNDSRCGASSTGEVKFSGGVEHRVATQTVIVNESSVGDAGSVVDGASSGGPKSDSRRERRRLVVGVACLSVAFLLQFTAHAGAVTLQSTVHGGADLGTRALVVQCAVLIFSSTLLPSLLIRYVGYKWTVAGSMAVYAPFVALQLWPREWTLLPAAALMGVGSGPLWAAKSAYLTTAASRWASLARQPPERVQLRFFALFYSIYNFSFVTGNMVSLLILTAGGAESVPGGVCGAAFCPQDRGAAANPNLRPPPPTRLATLFGALLACIACAVLLVALTVRPLHSDQEGERRDAGAWPALRLVAAAARLHRDPLQLLVAPIAAFTGLTQAFLNADFTEAFVSCSWGVAHTGGVLSCYGGACCLGSSLLGFRGRRLRHAPLVTAYAGCYCLLLTALFLWSPAPDTPAPFFLLAAFWGVADSGILVVNSVCGVMFRGRERAAYSNLRMWETVGFLCGYAWSPLLCMRVKLAAMAALLAVAVCGYWAAECLARRRAVSSFWIQGDRNNRQEAGSQRAALEGRWQKPLPVGNT